MSFFDGIVARFEREFLCCEDCKPDSVAGQRGGQQPDDGTRGKKEAWLRGEWRKDDVFVGSVEYGKDPSDVLFSHAASGGAGDKSPSSTSRWMPEEDEVSRSKGTPNMVDPLSNQGSSSRGASPNGRGNRQLSSPRERTSPRPKSSPRSNQQGVHQDLKIPINQMLRHESAISPRDSGGATGRKSPSPNDPAHILGFTRSSSAPDSCRDPSVSEKIAFWRTNSSESKSSASPRGAREMSPRAAKQALATKSSGSWNDRSRQGFVGMGGVGISHSEEFRRTAEDFKRPEKKAEFLRRQHSYSEQQKLAAEAARINTQGYNLNIVVRSKKTAKTRIHGVSDANAASGKSYLTERNTEHAWDCSCRACLRCDVPGVDVVRVPSCGE